MSAEMAMPSLRGWHIVSAGLIWLICSIMAFMNVFSFVVLGSIFLGISLLTLAIGMTKIVKFERYETKSTGSVRQMPPVNEPQYNPFANEGYASQPTADPEAGDPNSDWIKRTSKQTISLRVFINKSERKELQKNGIHLSGDSIGGGYYGTVYKGYRKSETTNKLQAMAIKVIDVQMYHKILMQINEIDYKSLSDVFNKSVVTLEKIQNNKIPKIEKLLKISAKDNEIKKLIIVSVMADMNLSDFISQQKPDGLDEDWTRLWFTDICEAVHCLHNVYKIAHKNIKPENILLYTGHQTINTKTSYVVRLADSGIASLFPNSAKVYSKTDPICLMSSLESFSTKPMAKDIYNIESQSLKELLESMTSSAPNARPNIHTVLKHKWLQNIS
ncbi:unnamed protein product [Medioppia subpectinata]|uniref:Protein kinase domain-containing protein n=1 Tax=Medioppia subpectinata TaxID=1979941 RepID=A0A7R9KLR4_9ACAR|nr:unnamed protein product [Medioppia subpectinata]CAG2104820.1 unnamed protein product [Medioppia subpectinata]